MVRLGAWQAVIEGNLAAPLPRPIVLRPSDNEYPKPPIGTDAEFAKRISVVRTHRWDHVPWPFAQLPLRPITKPWSMSENPVTPGGSAHPDVQWLTSNALRHPSTPQLSLFAETSPVDLCEIAAHQTHRIFCRRRALENGFPIGWSASRVLICTRMTTVTVRSLGLLNLRSTLDELT